MPESIGNSNRISREYIDSLRIETRYMDAVCPETQFTLYGETFASPIMTAALSHLDKFMFPGAALALAKGAAAANAVLWYGMAEEEEVERLAATGARLIEIVKPYADRKALWRKLEHADKLGALAVGIDIDHAFGPEGGPDIVNGFEMKALSTPELKEICQAIGKPVIVKGVLSAWDAERCLSAGARGLVLSHHNNRIEYALPPLALGAAGVCVGRPLMTAIREDMENGVCNYLNKARGELAKAMAFTGSASLDRIDPAVLHRV